MFVILTAAGTWAYFATILTSLNFTLVPFISLVLGWHPVTFSRQVCTHKAGQSLHPAAAVTTQGKSKVPPVPHILLPAACARTRVACCNRVYACQHLTRLNRLLPHSSL
jgi:hypothetical protein